MVNYCVIIGNRLGCHTREDYSSQATAKARETEWRGAGYTAQAFEVRIDLETLEVTHTPLN